METERLLIRRFNSDDWQDLFGYLSQEEVVKYEPYEVFTEEASRNEAVRRASDGNFWAVCLKDCQKLIGNIYLSKQDYDTWELGYVFNSRFWGNGYATEAARAVMAYAFDNKAHRVMAMCNPLNKSSWRLLERLGLNREGHLRRNVFFKRDGQGNPVWLDTYIYAILAEEYFGSFAEENV